jgi:hypothetical protein
MDQKPTKKQVLGYYRMGLVTGIVDKGSVVTWADQEIMQSPVPEDDIIELSLSSRLPYSQMIRLLSSFQGEPDYDLPLKLLFARAGILFEEDPGRAVAILMGLRLLNEEEYLPKELRSQITGLQKSLDLYKQAELPFEELAGCLSGFLDRSIDYRSLVLQIP